MFSFVLMFSTEHSREKKRKPPEGYGNKLEYILGWLSWGYQCFALSWYLVEWHQACALEHMIMTQQMF